MNATLATAPRQTAPPLIILHLRIPEIFLSVKGAPFGYEHLPARLLAALITSNLRQHELAGKACGVGAFNDCKIFITETPDVHAALARLHQTLSEHHLLPFATVRYYDPDENFMRPFCSGWRADSDPIVTLVEVSADYESLKKQLEDQEVESQHLFDLARQQLQANPPSDPAQP